MQRRCATPSRCGCPWRRTGAGVGLSDVAAQDVGHVGLVGRGEHDAAGDEAGQVGRRQVTAPDFLVVVAPVLGGEVYDVLARFADDGGVVDAEAHDAPGSLVEVGASWLGDPGGGAHAFATSSSTSAWHGWS